MIIRLIDIVLIVLFGFIVISDIDIKGNLPLPSPGKKEAVTVQKIPVTVEIDEKDVYWVSRRGGQRVRQAGVESLENYLAALNRTMSARGETPGVVIRPHAESTVQATIDVLDVCRRLDIPRNIARKSLAL